MDRLKNRSSDEMNPKLWGTLPENLLDKVLSGLPFEYLISLRQVSRNWNNLILSGRLSPTNPKPTNVVMCSSPGRLYLTSIPLMRSLSLSFLQPRRENLELVATDGGLLCFRIAPTDDFIVCNPMTKSWKKLPSITEDQITGPGFWAVTGMLHDPDDGSFKVVAVNFGADGDGVDNWGYVLKGTKIYSSTDQSWSFSLQEKRILGAATTFRKQNFHNKSFFHDEFLYIMKSEDNPGAGHAVLIFSMERRSWVELPVDNFTVSWRPAYPVCYRRQVYIVAEEEDSASGFGTVAVWKLVVQGGVHTLWSLQSSERIKPWMKVKTIYPGTLVSKNCKGPSFRWTCLGMGDLFCFLITQNKPAGQRRNPVTEMVQFNLFGESWTQVWLAIHDVPDPEFCSFQPSLSVKCFG